mmetsp:Transcript_4760/g.6004  ORF Transcript_4760/g.6004 Transcript_4760/m.6004 type:complete len:258 (-) Transcript_4760:397-1170(-)
MTSLSAADIITGYVCPSLGVILSNAVFFAPIRALSSAIKSKSLGELNPLPWAYMTGNCLGWVAYSYMTKNVFVFLANGPGLLCSVWLNAGAVKLQYCEVYVNDNGESSIEQDLVMPKTALTKQEKALLAILSGWTAVLTGVAFMEISNDTKEMIVGIVVNVNLVFFYGAPLSTIATVVQSRDSSSIHGCTMMTSLLNCTFWTIYAVAVKDKYIFIPNAAGLCLSIIQAILYFGCPKQTRERTELVVGLIDGQDHNIA